jgi:hypothetical protein
MATARVQLGPTVGEVRASAYASLFFKRCGLIRIFSDEAGLPLAAVPPRLGLDGVYRRQWTTGPP